MAEGGFQQQRGHGRDTVAGGGEVGRWGTILHSPTPSRHTSSPGKGQLEELIPVSYLVTNPI